MLHFFCRDFLNLFGCKLEPATVSCSFLSVLKAFLVNKAVNAEYVPFM